MIIIKDSYLDYHGEPVVTYLSGENERYTEDNIITTVEKIEKRKRQIASMMRILKENYGEEI